MAIQRVIEFVVIVIVIYFAVMLFLFLESQIKP